MKSSNILKSPSHEFHTEMQDLVIVWEGPLEDLEIYTSYSKNASIKKIDLIINRNCNNNQHTRDERLSIDYVTAMAHNVHEG